MILLPKNITIAMAMIFAHLISPINYAYADACSQFEASGTGVPALYFQEKCLAENAMTKKAYDEAIIHYQKADAVPFHEAPNYRLRTDWAKALCLSGKKNEGLEKLNSFILMAEADLGDIECPEDFDINPEKYASVKYAYLHLGCEGYGSVLSEEGEKELKEQLKEAKTIKTLCKKNGAINKQ